MGFAEALSDDGSLTGRGKPVVRGVVCGAMTTAGGIGHTLPYLIADFQVATGFAIAVVAVELGVISWIRHRFMETPILARSGAGGSGRYSCVSCRAVHRQIIRRPVPPLVEYEDASPDVRAIYDDIRSTRKTDYINNFWKALAQHPETLRRTWDSIKQVMSPGALDPLTKEMLYLAVSMTNQCGYCTASHSAAARTKGMTEEMMGELLAVVGLANQTNALAAGYRVAIDEQFR